MDKAFVGCAQPFLDRLRMLDLELPVLVSKLKELVVVSLVAVGVHCPLGELAKLVVEVDSVGMVGFLIFILIAYDRVNLVDESFGAIPESS